MGLLMYFGTSPIIVVAHMAKPGVTCDLHSAKTTKKRGTFFVASNPG